MIRNHNFSYSPYIQLLFLCFLMTFLACRKSQHIKKDSFYHEKYNLAYGSDPFQHFDLFLPEGHDHNTKVILLIHGGGWVSGDKWDCDYYAKKFASSGFAAASMNYRLANDTLHYRQMLADIDSMISCILKNSGNWGIGSGPLALFGYSAGGHLALLYAFSADKERNIGAVVSLAGPTDIQDSLLWESPGLYNDIILLTGDPSPVNWTKANPIHFISGTNPPTLLIHGTNDSVVPFSQSLRLNQLLEVSNTRVKMIVLENETHFFSPGATEKFITETKNFLDANL